MFYSNTMLLCGLWRLNVLRNTFFGDFERRRGMSRLFRKGSSIDSVLPGVPDYRHSVNTFDCLSHMYDSLGILRFP